MNVISLFAGIGGFDLAFERAGHTVVAQVEIDTNARNVLETHFPGVSRFQDVASVGAHNLPASHIIVGGFPCQDVSVAGLRAGLSGRRSGLFYEMVRIVNELRPAFLIWENVPGLLTSDHGRDFARVILSLANIGYYGAWRVLDAQYFGVPQRRRRLFGVFARADIGTSACAQILSLTQSRQRYFVTLASPSPDIARPLTASTSASGRFDASNETYVIGPLQAHSKEHGHAMTTQQAAESNQLVLVGTFNGYTGGPDDNDAQNGHLVFEKRFTRNGRGAPSSVCPPLKAQSGKTGKGDSAPLLYAHSYRQDSVYGIQGTANALAVSRTRQMQSHLTTGGVRRLTPLECERLQGFPDGWTAGQSDSTRYRQLGNAVAVPVVEWIAKRIPA